MKTELVIALAQCLSDRDPEEIVAEAKQAAAEVVVFPEMFSNGYASFDPADRASVDRWHQSAQSSDGPFISKCREAARANGIHVVATFLEAGDPKPFNSALLIDPNGDTVLHHRKVHICDFDRPEVACAHGREFRAADIQTTVGPVRVGLMICMDREFPEAAWSLSLAGAEISFVPNCCTLATDKNQSDVRIAQMRGRAFETVMGIAVANYPVPRADGHSFAVDPNGRVIAMANQLSGITIATFDLEVIRRMRTEDRFRWQVQPTRSSSLPFK